MKELHFTIILEISIEAEIQVLLLDTPMLKHYKKHIGCSTPIKNWETILELKYAKYWT